MLKSKKLSEIAITHISLVKAGANGKSIIYKSADAEPLYDKTIKIIKSNNEEGVVYGIVYSPEEVDSQGDFASADEIQKAAYAFMKNRNTLNVDKNHTFEVEKAYIAQSWLLKDNDPVFPDEKAGSWAVAIKLEDEDLIKAVKKGEIAGISMAGTAQKEDVEKADEKSFSLSDLLVVLTKAFSLGSHVENNKINKQESTLNKEVLEAAVSAAVESLVKKVGDLEANVVALQKSADEHAEALKKSKQDNDPETMEVKKQNSTGGIL